MILITGGAGFMGRSIARALRTDVTLPDDFRATPRVAAAGWPVKEADVAVAKVDWGGIDAVVCLVREERAAEFEETSTAAYRRATGRACTISFCRSADGARENLVRKPS